MARDYLLLRPNIRPKTSTPWRFLSILDLPRGSVGVGLVLPRRLLGASESVLRAERLLRSLVDLLWNLKKDLLPSSSSSPSESSSKNDLGSPLGVRNPIDLW